MPASRPLACAANLDPVVVAERWRLPCAYGLEYTGSPGMGPPALAVALRWRCPGEEGVSLGDVARLGREGGGVTARFDPMVDMWDEGARSLDGERPPRGAVPGACRPWELAEVACTADALAPNPGGRATFGMGAALLGGRSAGSRCDVAWGGGGGAPPASRCTTAGLLRGEADGGAGGNDAEELWGADPWNEAA